LLKEHCEQKYGSGKTGDRIVCITDGKESVLRTTAQKEGYTTYEIPPDVGGRYSVLSPVGLLPIAVGGFDVFALLEGAKTMRQQLLNTQDNIAFRYAAVRNYLLQQGRNIEVLSVFEPKLYYMTEWWKQLFGESEGKAGKGIFPVGMTFSTDLHSLGQYMQEGQRIMFETFLSIARSKEECRIPFANDNEDGLNFLANKRIGELNNTVEKATMLAHRQGDVPVMQITMDTLDEKNTGELIYFFEYACAISAYMLGVNPFNQSGVDTYKENMFALLEKPGYEQKNKQLRENLSDI
jgi:glucose-6-phosphate isomerase